jgi:hypothetical protein
MQGTFGQSLVKIDKMVSKICVILKKTSVEDGDDPAPQLLGHLICLFTLLPTKNYVDRPKTKSAITLTKIILKICTFSIKNHDFTRKKQ